MVQYINPMTLHLATHIRPTLSNLLGRTILLLHGVSCRANRENAIPCTNVANFIASQTKRFELVKKLLEYLADIVVAAVHVAVKIHEDQVRAVPKTAH